jgi:ABC-type sugar transport system ATPase subunit
MEETGSKRRETVVACRGVTKRFGGQVAVDGVDCDPRAGEVHVPVKQLSTANQ